MWRWYWAVKEALPSQEPPLLLNLDETAVRFYYTPQRGFKLGNVSLKKPTGRLPTRGCLASTKRRAVTLVAIICNDSGVQPHLPQWILGSNHVFTEARRQKPSLNNIRLRVAKSAWVNTDVLEEIVCDLGETCARVAPGRPCIFFMDALKAHYAPKVLAAANRWNLIPLILPASCTYFMQPLDTDVFSGFKRHLRRCLYTRTRHTTDDDVTPADVVACIEESVRFFLQGKEWDNTFSRNGFGCVDCTPRPSILRELEWEQMPRVEKTLPSFDEWTALFPRHTVIPFAELFHVLCRYHPEAYAHSIIRFEDPEPPLRHGSIDLSTNPSSKEGLAHMSAITPAAGAAAPHEEPGSSVGLGVRRGPMTRRLSRLIESQEL